MTNLADRVIAALRSGHDDLAAYVANLDESDLTGPSGAREWSVADVLSHLGSGAEITRTNLERALSGAGRPEQGYYQTVWDRWNAMTPTAQRDGFIESNRLAVESFENLDATTREELRIDLAFLPAPVSVADTGRLRLTEFALHTWDVKVAVDADTRLAPEAVPLLGEGLAPLLGWIAKPAALDGRHAVLAIDLTDPDESSGLRLDDSVTIVERPEQPDGTLHAPAEAWLRLLSGRLAPEHTPASVRVSGAITLDDLRRVFPGY